MRVYLRATHGMNAMGLESQDRLIVSRMTRLNRCSRWRRGCGYFLNPKLLFTERPSEPALSLCGSRFIRECIEQVRKTNPFNARISAEELSLRYAAWRMNDTGFSFRFLSSLRIFFPRTISSIRYLNLLNALRCVCTDGFSRRRSRS